MAVKNRNKNLRAFFPGTVSTESGLRLLFPSAHRQYVYSVMTNVSTSTLTPRESGTYWTIEGKLLIDVRDNFTRARLQLKDLKVSVGQYYNYIIGSQLTYTSLCGYFSTIAYVKNESIQYTTSACC